jgi:uncharacterized protein (DUF1684 family)
MKTRPLLSLGMLLAALLLITGCGDNVQDTPGDSATGKDAPGPLAMNEVEHDRWEIDLVEMRIERNEEYRQPQRTPLRKEDLPKFEGLEYFFPEPGLRFRTPFIAEAGDDTVLLTKRSGEQVPYKRRGKVRFTHEGKVHSLAVFGPADPGKDDYLWLPFFDATNGKETYAGGRYLDLEIGPEGMVILDFNFAYNPLCDYNPDKYNCTLPPAENTLPFPVRAGEKTLFASP